MRIRRAAAGDAEAVANVFLAARAGMVYLPELHTEGETRAWIRDVVLPGLEVWLVEEGGGVAGYAALGEELLEHLYVRPDAHGRGVSTALLDVAKARRPGGLLLWVFQRNDIARRFYERRGFRLVRLTEGRGNEEREPDALYEWRPAAGGG